MFLDLTALYSLKRLLSFKNVWQHVVPSKNNYGWLTGASPESRDRQEQKETEHCRLT